MRALTPRRGSLSVAACVAVLVAALFPASPVLSQDSGTEDDPIFVDQGLNRSEERAFKESLKILLKNPDVDMVVTVRPGSKARMGCKKAGDVYWIYSARGTVCFTRAPKGAGWGFSVQVIKGKNPVREQSATVLWTLAQERAAGTPTDEPEPRVLIDAKKVTYPYVYERIVAELDGPRAGDFIIVPANTADSGSPGAHGHPGITQSRTTLILGGRGARRSPLSKKAEAKLHIKHPDIAPTVASALGIHPYFQDTNEPATLLNGNPSETALLKRQDGRVLQSLLEPVYNTFVVSIDGLGAEFVTPGLMPNLTTLLEEECAPGGVCATSFEQARAMMVTETNANHTAMITGAYGEDSGIIANGSFDRAGGAELDLDRPELNFAETLFDSIERSKPWLRTALVMGKEKLRSLFDCTRDTEGACGPSDANPEKREVDHVAPDFIAGATTSPGDQNLDCPAEPGTGSGYSLNSCTMDAALYLLGAEDPDFTFINLPEVDAMSHLFGRDSEQAAAAIVSADLEIGRLVAALRASNRWQRSTVIVTADHAFGPASLPLTSTDIAAELEGAGPSESQVVSHGGSASVYLPQLENVNEPTEGDQQTLKALRAAALEIEGVSEALYRLPNPLDGGREHTLNGVHPNWNLGGTPRIGELLIVAEEGTSFHVGQMDDDRLITGVHGHPSDRHIPLIVMSGGTYVRDGSIVPSGEPNEGDDTGELKEQAENVDIAATISWLLDVPEPRDSSGRLLSQAFSAHPAEADRAGAITEALANRLAIFIYDQNNSVTVRCLIDSSTCGDPVPEEAKDPESIPNLTAVADGGLFTRFGSVAAWPSVTMPNHNTVGSGTYPGHHALVNNRFYERETATVHAPIDPQDPDNPLYVGTSVLLNDEFETLHEAFHRSFGDWTPADGPVSDNAYTASVDEPSARGADYATLEPTDSFPNPADYIATQNPAELAQDTTQACSDSDPDGYGVESTLDHQGQTQVRRLFEDNAQHPIPKYLINNFTLTDGSGHHFGPHTTCTIAAFRDSDKRLGRILEAMRSAGVLGETLVVVTGDHGGENQNLDRAGLPSDFETVLNDAGIKHVMADWHVYLLTTNAALEGDLVRGSTSSVVVTVTEDDRGEPVEGATVEFSQAGAAAVTGETDAEGKVTLEVTLSARRLRVVVTHPDYNTSARKHRIRKG